MVGGGGSVVGGDGWSSTDDTVVAVPPRWSVDRRRRGHGRLRSGDRDSATSGTWTKVLILALWSCRSLGRLVEPERQRDGVVTTTKAPKPKTTERNLGFAWRNENRLCLRPAALTRSVIELSLFDAADAGGTGGPNTGGGSSSKSPSGSAENRRRSEISSQPVVDIVEDETLLPYRSS